MVGKGKITTTTQFYLCINPLLHGKLPTIKIIVKFCLAGVDYHYNKILVISCRTDYIT